MSTINRRQFLSCIIAAGLTPKLFAKPSPIKEYFISAQGKSSSNYGMALFNNSNNNLTTTLSDFRGHGVMQNPANPKSILMFSRRPGKTVLEIDILSGKIIQQFFIDDDNSLMGHGCFSADGHLLFTAEADSYSGEGKIIVRETRSYKKTNEFKSYGIGPHEIKIMPDNKTLVIANGGILTRAESGREKLNLDTMKSSLTYIDITSGNKISQHAVSENKASIRHLDVANDGTVAIAMQIQRQVMNNNNISPLAAIHKPGQEIISLDKPNIIIEKMNDYVGSVSINNHSRNAGFTSPRGNLVAFWNIDTGTFSGYHQLNDVCGISTSIDNKYFIISNSQGEIRQLNAFTLKENISLRINLKNTHFDNHMITASI